MPNGYGSVYKIGCRKERFPYKVKVTVGYKLDEKTKKPKEIRKLIGSYENSTDAYQALAEYFKNRNVWSLEDNTFSEIYKAWYDEYYVLLSESSQYAYNHAFELSFKLHRMNIKEIKLIHLQEIIDTCEKNYPTLKTLVNLYHKVYDYAMKHDLVLKDITQYIDIKKHKNKNPNKIYRDKFSREMISSIWENQKEIYDSIALLLIYTGTRISELLNLKKENVHLEKQYFEIIKSKTSNGVREIPIANKVLPFFKQWLESSQSEYVFVDRQGYQMRYAHYVKCYFKPLMISIGSSLTAHCCRHTFISMLVEENVSQTIIKSLVGHAGAMSIAERVYTHLDMEQLLEAVNRL